MNQRIGRLLHLFFCGLAVCSFAPRSFAVEFRAKNTYSVGTNPTSLAIADFNADGKLDIVVANTGSSDASVLLGRGDGTFHPSVSFPAGLTPSQVLVADFNGDNKPDLVLLQPGDGNTQAAQISVLLGNGDGTFQGPKVTTLSPSTGYFVAADFNRDKKADLIVTSSDPSTGALTLEILVGNGDGTFQPAKLLPSNVASTVFAVADFNGDGNPDLAIVVPNGAQLLLSNGDGTFQEGSTATVSGSVDTLWIGDINNDNQPDLIVESSARAPKPPGCHIFCPTNLSQTVSVFLNNNGTLGTEMVFFSGGEGLLRTDLIRQIVPGEFNGDTKTDLLTDHDPGGFSIALGRADGSFAVPFPMPLDAATALAARDLNGDRLDDLVALDSENNLLIVLLNDSQSSGADMAIALAHRRLDPMGAGMAMSYSAGILNEGPGGATNIVFTDTLPAGVSFVSATTTQGSCSQAKLVVTCDVGSLASAGDAAITIAVTPAALPTLTNSMSVSATEDDLALANNSVTQTDSTYTLTVTKAGSGTGTVTGNWGTTLPFDGFSCGPTCSPLFLGGTAVHLSASADSNSTFQSWDRGCSGASGSTCDVTMTANMTVAATFVITPDFVVTPASTSLNVTRGNQVSDPLMFPAQGGFSGTIALTCSITGPAPAPTCSISPNSVTPANSATLTVNADGPSAALAPQSFPDHLALFAATVPFAGLGFFLLPCERRKKRSGRKILIFASFTIAIFLAGCGSGHSTPPPPVSQGYVVTVTATSGAIRHSATINVTVK